MSAAMAYVEAYLDDPVIGCGTRRLVVVTMGRKYVTVIDPASLRSARIELAAWRRAAPVPCLTSIKVIARRMRRLWREHKRLGIGAAQEKYRGKTLRILLAIDQAVDALTTTPKTGE
jgi:hypothetical protein